MNSRLTIASVALGVRFEPQFAIRDRIGAIVDEVLRARDSPFSPSFFPQSRSRATSHLLLNPENGDNLQISQQDAILHVDLATSDLERVVLQSKNFKDFVLGPLRRLARAGSVARYGALFEFTDCRSEIETLPATVFLGDRLAHEVSLRFVRRLGMESALTEKAVSDFRTVIYDVQQDNNDDVRFSLDYQENFSPVLPNFGDRPFDEFGRRATDYVTSTFEKWLEATFKLRKAA